MQYMSGFGGHFSSEALPGALPCGQNSPQLCPYGLYAEQLSGSAFTTPRCKNLRSWLYRIRPSVMHTKFQLTENQRIFKQMGEMETDPNQLRWSPVDLTLLENKDIDFVGGMTLVCGAGEPSLKEGISIYNYAFNSSMKNKAMYNSDGDILIVPQHGTLNITTELGKLSVEPCEIVVIPRGIKFTVEKSTSNNVGDNEFADCCRGYIAEIYQGHFELPNLGPIGANGLANPRDFETPVAYFEDIDMNTNNNDDNNRTTFTLMNKFQGKWFSADMFHSPFDVVAWHGNYCPFKYDLRRFNCMNTVGYDHPDPSIYTVLTVPTNEVGVAALDFVIFPPRKSKFSYSII